MTTTLSAVRPHCRGEFERPYSELSPWRLRRRSLLVVWSEHAPSGAGWKVCASMCLIKRSRQAVDLKSTCPLDHANVADLASMGGSCLPFAWDQLRFSGPLHLFFFVPPTRLPHLVSIVSLHRLRQFVVLALYSILAD